MRFALRPDGSRPNRHDADSALFEVLGTQTCHTLHSLRTLKGTWTVALRAAGLSIAKIKRLWYYVLDRVRPTWWADEMETPDNVVMDWTTATRVHFVEFYELTEMLDFLWAALRTHVCRPEPAISPPPPPPPPPP